MMKTVNAWAITCNEKLLTLWEMHIAAIYETEEMAKIELAKGLQHIDPTTHINYKVVPAVVVLHGEQSLTGDS